MAKKKTYTKREIDLTNFNQVRNAAMSFKVTEDQLKDAVRAVGPIIENIQVYLKAYHNPLVNRRKRGFL